MTEPAVRLLRLAAFAVVASAIAGGVWYAFLREPPRGFNEQEAVLGRTLDDSDEPPVRLSSVAARLKKVRTFRYLTLGIGMLGLGFVSGRATARTAPA